MRQKTSQQNQKTTHTIQDRILLSVLFSVNEVWPMTPESFIEKHITAALVAEGFPLSVAQGGGRDRIGLLPLQLTGKQEGSHVR
ncbi:Uncharacterised protein [Serratia proteamaculans]|nr:Uncharacterised protein [Serratia proteamaculans]